MKLRWLMVPLIAGAAYYAIFGGEYSLMEMRRLEREKTAEAEKLQQTRNEVTRLRSWADSLETDSATLERTARERYGMIRKGERLYRFVDSANAKPLARDSTVR
ncbi:MAG: FtsB family cell division protein [Gemmatimonadota bacterium]